MFSWSASWSWAIVLGVAVIFGWLRQRSRNRLPFPPGPPGLPLLKNLLDMPMSLEYLTYQKWGEIYGDVSHMSVLGNHFIILNSQKAAVELLDQKSVIYSDRPYFPMMHDEDLMDLNFAFGIKRYSRTWKLHRRLFTQHINPTTVSGQFAPRQLTTAYKLLHDLLSNPSDVLNTFNHASASMVLGITYGYGVKPEKDPLIKLATGLLNEGLEGTTAKFLVNVFPTFKYLHWLPGVTFKQFAAKVKGIHRRLNQMAFDGAKQRIDSSDYTPSFVQNALAAHTESHHDDPEALQAIKDVAVQMYGAGVDTTATTLHNITLQLILHPDIQARAHAELNAVLGSPDNPSFRFPTFEDRSALPYIDAVIKEGLRFAPPAPLGMPHATLEEDEYRGWRIPKGSIIIPHAYGMNRDEKVYPNPSKFDPERFIEKKGKPAQRDPAGTFGFGRRICPGRHLAESFVWIETVCLLAAFTIEPPMDGSTGKPMDLRWAERHQPGALLRFGSYPCVFKPRSSRVEKVIREMALHAAA